MKRRWKALGAAAVLLAVLGAKPKSNAASAPSPPPSARAAAAVVSKQQAFHAPLPGPASPYEAALIDVWRGWNKRAPWRPQTTPENPIAIRMYRTPGSEYYIGMEKQMIVRAPLARLDAVIDGFNQYRSLFPDFKVIREESREGNRVEVFFQRGVPVPFVPDIFYRLTYLLDKSDPKRKVYRYHLKESNNLKQSDGLIFLEAVNANETRFHAFDFYEADWSLLKVMGADRIWRDSITGTFLSDLAIKLRAENPDWTFDQIRRERSRIASHFDAGKVPFMDKLER